MLRNNAKLQDDELDVLGFGVLKNNVKTQEDELWFD